MSLNRKHLTSIFTALLLTTFIASCGSGGISSSDAGSNGGGGSGGGIISGGDGTPGAGGDSVGGGGISLPPGGFPDSGFEGGGEVGGVGGDGASATSPVVSLDVEGEGSTGGNRGTATFAVGVTTAGISEIKATIENANAVQFIAQAGGNSLAGAVLSGTDSLVAIQTPAEGPQQTSAVYLASSINSMPYPTSGVDAAISSGTEYRYQLISSASTLATINGAIVAKNDPSFFSGTLRVQIFIVGTIAQESDSRIAINNAIDIWRDIYAAAGITLVVTISDISSGTGIIPNPGVGSSFFTANATTEPYSLNMYIGQGISNGDSTSPGDTFDNSLLGVAPSVPGPALTTIKSAVALNILAHSGVDGVFSSDEVEVLGETMAHEAGHYLGLFHPVEFTVDSDTDSFTVGDRLIDTPTCATLGDCTAIGLVTNLMFPAAVSGVPMQRGLTTQQSTVLNLQVLVD